jgi:hypothetical protein
VAGVALFSGVFIFVAVLQQFRLATWRRTWLPAPPAWMSLTQRLAKRVGLNRPFSVFIAPGLSQPVAVGVIRPAIVLPALSGKAIGPALRGALSHELGHLVSRDPLWNLIGQIVTAIAWWCPLAWWLRRRARIESELTADDCATKSGVRPTDLAKILARFAEANHIPIPAAISPMACHLRRRIEMMMNDKDSHNPRSTFSARWATILSGLVIALAVIATPLVGTVRAEDDDRTDPPPVARTDPDVKTDDRADDRPDVRTDPDVKTDDRREHEREREHLRREKKTKATPLFSENFDNAKLKSRKWYDMTRIRIADGALAGKGCIEYKWIDKKSKGQASSSMRHLFKPTDKVYIRFYLKLSKGWGWTGRNYHPHLVHFLTTENPKYHGPAASHLTLYVEPVNGKLRLAATDIQNKSMPHGLTQGRLKGGYNGKFYDSRKVLFKDDKWHCVEAYFKLNTLDLKNDRPNRDGIVRGWFDGKLVVEHTDVILRSTDFPKMKFNHFLMAPYFGPGLLPHAQKLWIDELVVGINRIGPIPTRRTPTRERRREKDREMRERREPDREGRPEREDHVIGKRLERAENKVADLEEMLEKAEENLKKMLRLQKEGHANEGAVEKAERRFKKTRERLHDAQAELKKLRKTAQARRAKRIREHKIKREHEEGRERGERRREDRERRVDRREREGRGERRKEGERSERKDDVEELREQIRHLQRQLKQAERKLKRIERERQEREERDEHKEHREHEED